MAGLKGVCCFDWQLDWMGPQVRRAGRTGRLISKRLAGETRLANSADVEPIGLRIALPAAFIQQLLRIPADSRLKRPAKRRKTWPSGVS
jgi:hypothetical protein